jgi:hypothetical protein
MYKVAFLQQKQGEPAKSIEKQVAAVKKISGFDFEKPLRRKLAMLSDLIDK